MRYQARALTTYLCALTLVLSWGAVPAPAEAAAPAADVDIPAVLQQTKDYQLRFRDGELDVATANVALLEQATAAETGNADLWQAMGLAYVYLAARATLPGGNRGDLMFALQKGMPALNRALQIDPDHAEALSVRAGMRALMGRGLNQPQLVSQALSDMNRAVELAPESVSVRLTRAFGGPGMPEDLRNRANEAADLDFLIEVSEWNRAGNFMTILRADLHLENGEVDSARELYQVIVGTGAASAAQLARSRLALLPQGKDAVMKDILALRAVAGTQCSMCHGREDVVASAR
jgi:tetratricopeptide (TPR) repeat protein